MRISRFGAAVAIAVSTGVGCVYGLPAPWLGPIAGVAAICAFVLALVIRLIAVVEKPTNPVAGILQSLVNLPDQPFAKVKEGWSLAAFLVLAAFLASLALSVMVRANA